MDIRRGIDELFHVPLVRAIQGVLLGKDSAVQLVVGAGPRGLLGVVLILLEVKLLINNLLI